MVKHNLEDLLRRMGVENVVAKLKQGGKVQLDDRYCPLCRCPVPKSEKDKFKLVLKRAKIGRTWAQNMAGTMHMSGRGVKKNDTEAARWFKKAAEAGITDAMTAYADCSCDGIGVPMSIIDAKFWYEKASDAGGMVAQYNLGLMLSSGGPGVPADPVGAARLFRKGADQGHDNAQCNLGH